MVILNASSECPTCCTDYDGGEHRVRILHCGHSQCTSCIQAQFSNMRITCALCRTRHNYPDLDSIPVNYIAETLLGEKDAAPQAPKLHKGICEEHATYKLFWCNTHHEWICMHCSISNHPTGNCEVIPIKKMFENDKESIISNIFKQVNQLENAESEIKLSINEVYKLKEEEIGNIKKIKEEIDKLKKSIDQKERDVAVLNARHSKYVSSIKECKRKKSNLEDLIPHVQGISTFKELDFEKEMCALVFKGYENWKTELEEDKTVSLFNRFELPDMIETLNKLENTEEKNAMAQEIKKMLLQKVKRRKMYAKKNIGNTKYYSSIEQRDGCLILKELQPKVSPVLEFDDIMGLVRSPPVAFFTMAHRRRRFTLGCIHITLDGPPRYIQQFLDLATGNSGRGSWRASGFDRLLNKGHPGERVRCGGYTDLAGFQQSDALYNLEDLTGGARTPLNEGDVYGRPSESAGFRICTRTKANDTLPFPVIGKV
ncbi:unnamed protein product, partial [Meganyctiphanes norvegica]